MDRQTMEQVIKDGGSVLYEGRVISKVEQLPSAADLAKGDPDAEAATRQSLQEQINSLQTQLATLTQSGSSTPPSTPPTEEQYAVLQDIENGPKSGETVGASVLGTQRKIDKLLADGVIKLAGT